MKFILSIALFCCCSLNLFAQTNWLWGKCSTTSSTTGTTDCMVGSVCSDAAGNVFATGYFGGTTVNFGSSVVYNRDNAGVTYDMFLVKYDASGNVLWATSAGGGGWDGGASVSTDAQGDVYVTGSFQGQVAFFGSITIINGGNGDNLFVAKYDPNGNLLWMKYVPCGNGNSSAIEGFGINVAPNGDVLVTGNFSDQSLTFGTTTLTNYGIYNTFVARFDANGNIIWVTCPSGQSANAGTSICTDAFGNVFVTGFFYNQSLTFGSLTIPNFGINDIYIVKFDPNGNALWAKSEGGPKQDEGASISTDSAGNIFVTGDFQSPAITIGSTTLTNADALGNTFDLFYAKYDGTGNLLWAKSAGGPDDDFGESISVNSGGDFFLTGTFSSATLTLGSSTLTSYWGAGTSNLFIAKCDLNANVLCATRLEIASGQASVSFDPLGNAFVGAGFGANLIIIGPDTLLGSGSADGIVAKYNCCGLSSLTITSDTTIGPGQSVTLTVSGGASYYWSNGLSDSSIVVSASGNYCVNATSGDCSGSACVQVNVLDECNTDLFIANAFSPNGDGQNDVVRIHFTNPFCINTFYIAIYDRWGEKVFESTDPDFQWDGSYHGQKMFSQVLDYFIQTTTLDGKENLKAGNISLVL